MSRFMIGQTSLLVSKLGARLCDQLKKSASSHARFLEMRRTCFSSWVPGQKPMVPGSEWGYYYTPASCVYLVYSFTCVFLARCSSQAIKYVKLLQVQTPRSQRLHISAYCKTSTPQIRVSSNASVFASREVS
jgi:hypothetical protein